MTRELELPSREDAPASGPHLARSFYRRHVVNDRECQKEQSNEVCPGNELTKYFSRSENEQSLSSDSIAILLPSISSRA